MSTAEQVMDIIAEEGVVARELVKPEATMDDLGVASLDIIMVLMKVEETFDIEIEPEEEAKGLSTVGDFIGLVEAKLRAEHQV